MSRSDHHPVKIKGRPRAKRYLPQGRATALLRTSLALGDSDGLPTYERTSWRRTR